jgi:hypothetical protein
MYQLQHTLLVILLLLILTPLQAQEPTNTPTPSPTPAPTSTAIATVVLTPNLLEDGPILIDQVVEIGNESTSWLWGFGAIILGFGVFAFIPKLWRRN